MQVIARAQSTDGSKNALRQPLVATASRVDETKNALRQRLAATASRFARCDPRRAAKAAR
jgi:hypothetical protein